MSSKPAITLSPRSLLPMEVHCISTPMGASSWMRSLLARQNQRQRFFESQKERSALSVESLPPPIACPSIRRLDNCETGLPDLASALLLLESSRLLSFPN